MKFICMLLVCILSFQQVCFADDSNSYGSGGSFNDSTEETSSHEHGIEKSWAELEEEDSVKYNGDSWLKIATGFIVKLGCEFVALKNGDFGLIMENEYTWSDYKNSVHVYDDGCYAFEVDFQEAIYNALMDYYSVSMNCKLMKPTGSAVYAQGYLTMYFPNSPSAYKLIDEKPLFCVLENNLYSIRPYFGTLLSYSTNTEYLKYYSSDSYITGDYLLGYWSNKNQGGLELWFGPNLIAYYSVEDALNALSSTAEMFIDPSPEFGTVYVTNDGLNYDWAAANSNMYSKIVQAIQDGDIVTNEEIGEYIKQLSKEIRDSLEKIEDAVDDTNSWLKKINNNLVTIRNWLVADTLIDKVDLLDDLTGFLRGVVDSTVFTGQVAPLVTLMKSKFPFSLPWDFYYVFNLFSSSPSPPQFIFPFEFYFNGEVVYRKEYLIDFTDFKLLSEISRCLLTVVFVYGLYNLTIKFVKKDGDE